MIRVPFPNTSGRDFDMRVIKFGGSSLGDGERIERAAGIAAEAVAAGPIVVVVSALGGTTDDLLAAADTACQGSSAEPVVGAAVDAIALRHREAATVAARASEVRELEARFDAVLADLRELLSGIALVGECSPRSRDRVVSVGERLSSMIMAGALRKLEVAAEDADARQFIRTDDRHGHAYVDLDETRRLTRAWFEERTATQVVTGFIASGPDGKTTTLGRSGSDYTAALVGAALDASVVEIWTDVDGVMSADPRVVPDAFSLERLRYEELMELSHFGAKVVFPAAVQPARDRGIPLLIKNTLNPSFPGTRVSSVGDDRSFDERPITGIASINEVTLLRLEGPGMIGVPGVAARMFEALAGCDTNVILISQASSEHSICVAIDPASAACAADAVNTRFASEIAAGTVKPLVIEDDQCVVAVVGEGMRHRAGISGRLFRLLGRRGISVHAIAQGSSERNISIALARDDEVEALQAIHDSFFRWHDRTLKVVVAGVGGVGGAFLDQLEETKRRLAKERGIDVRLSGVVSSRFMRLDADGIAGPPDGDWRSWLESSGEAADLSTVSRFLERQVGPRALVDCTASDAVPALYRRLLEGHCSVVTANKRPFAGPIENDPRKRAPADGRGLYYEATVGAGLPVVRTLQGMVRAADGVERIEGVFSGTLGYVFGAIRTGQSWSSVVKKAHELGYTEPDPREDLSGMDVARKLLVLARDLRPLGESDAPALELGDLEVEALCDPALDGLSLADFWKRLPEQDEAMAARIETARSNGRVPVYLATLSVAEDGKTAGSVGWREVEPGHPAANLDGTDNVFIFTSRFYNSRPLVVIGPGAGREVTAGGLFADILRAHAESVRDPLVEGPWASQA